MLSFQSAPVRLCWLLFHTSYYNYLSIVDLNNKPHPFISPPKTGIVLTTVFVVDAGFLQSHLRSPLPCHISQWRLKSQMLVLPALLTARSYGPWDMTESLLWGFLFKKKKKSNIRQCPGPFPFPVIPTLSGIIIAGGQWSSCPHNEKKKQENFRDSGTTMSI